MKKKKTRKIRNAYDAYWFLYYHPKLNCMERFEITPEQASKMEEADFLISRDVGGQHYCYWRHSHRHALDANLDVFYTKTNKPGGHGRIDEDDSKNKYIECWLEFGPIYYGYSYSGESKPAGDYDTKTTLQHSHDYRLDAGGATFDEALIRLAKNVLNYYGDYNDALAESGSKRWCGKPVCGDCEKYKRKDPPQPDPNPTT